MCRNVFLYQKHVLLAITIGEYLGIAMKLYFEKSIYIAKTWQKGKKSLLNLFNCFKPIFELPKNPILCVHSITNINTLS